MGVAEDDMTVLRHVRRHIVLALVAWFLVLLAVGHGTRAVAQDKSIIEEHTDPVLQKAMNNWHQEMVQCLAFYHIVQEGLRRSGDSPENLEGVLRYQAIIDELMERVFMLHRPETTLARFKLESGRLGNEMYGDFSNISILLVKYVDLCKEVVENSDARFEHWYAFASEGR